MKFHVIFFIGFFPEPYLLSYIDDDTIIAIDLRTLHTTVAFSGLKNNGWTNLFVDYVGMKIYFNHGLKICRGNFDASNKEVLPSQDDISTFALDWIGRRLFWVHGRSRPLLFWYPDGRSREIYTGSLDLKFKRSLLTHVRGIDSLAVDSKEG